MTISVEAALGLGGNLGDVVGAFALALERLSALPDTRVLRVSSVYRTAPWGKTDQPDFLNIAVLISTALTPRALLDAALAIEAEAGRKREAHWGPRTLDIDVLTYGNARIDEPDLHIPHPRMAERAFVLVPLAEIAPALHLNGEAIGARAGRVGDQGVARDDAATLRLTAGAASIVLSS